MENHLKVRGRIPFMAMGVSSIMLAIAVLISGCGGGESSTSINKTELGKALFNSTNLSQPQGQACASCHQAANAFTDPRQDSPTSEGAVAGRFGKRQAPTIKYMAFSPPFHLDASTQNYVGGQFWDGRAVNLKDQVHFPMLNAAEMNNASEADIVTRVSAGPFANSLRQIYGATIFANPDQAFNAIADAIATFESSSEFSPFTSKYDFYLKGKATLTAAEAAGLALYKGKAQCATCHPSDPGADGTPPLFTNFTYANIGIPRNPQNRFYSMPPQINPDGAAFVDIGLMQTTNRPQDAGCMKVPTLRNIAITAPYFHNGIFKTLEQAVQFYNKRNLGIYPPPEVAQNVAGDLGNLQLTDQEVSDIVAFLQTLTDGYSPK